MAASPETIQDLALSWSVAVGALAALVFARAGALKLRDWSSLAGVVENYDLLPAFMAPPVAAVLPIVEITLAVALAVSAPFAALWPAPWLAAVPAAAAGLLLVFALAMAINLARGRSHIDCGCGDARGRQPLSAGLVIRNLAMAAALILAAALAPEPARGGARDLAAAVIGLAAGGAAFLLYLCQEAFAALPRRERSAPLPPPDPRLGFAVHHRTGGAR
jgi:hypothetical protein